MDGVGCGQMILIHHHDFLFRYAPTFSFSAMCPHFPYTLRPQGFLTRYAPTLSLHAIRHAHVFLARYAFTSHLPFLIYDGVTGYDEKKVGG